MTKFHQAFDMMRYRRLLRMQSDDEKEFFDTGGCGLEIEFGVVYERRCRGYIEAGLRKMKQAVGRQGKFVPDQTIGKDLNVEIVLIPLERPRLERLFRTIARIVNYYENFVFDDMCGVHANFRADAGLKRCFYRLLAEGGYDASRFCHSKYKTDFMEIVRPNGRDTLSYEEYIDYQHQVAGKYAGVNFLKERLVEFRTLGLNWEHIDYVIGLYEQAKRQYGG